MSTPLYSRRYTRHGEWLRDILENGGRRDFHGLSGTRIYSIWQNMKRRCNDDAHKSYKRYGGRGIKVCETWMERFSNFKEDMYKDYLEHCKIHGEKDTELDREDNNGNYSPENCHWVTRKENKNNKTDLYSNNKTGYKGVTFHKKSGKYVARLTTTENRKQLGYFKTPAEAHSALVGYKKAIL